MKRALSAVEERRTAMPEKEKNMKYALIGCGRIAVNHMKAALNNNLDIVAVCDIDKEKMEAILEKNNLQENK